MPAPITYSASDIITDALQKLGVYSSVESVTDADMARCLKILNDMLDGWQNEFMFLFSLTAVPVTLQNGAISYTIGPPGAPANIQTGRPTAIQTGPGAASVVDGATTYPVNVISGLEWSAISASPIQGIPDTLYYDAQYPVGVLNVSPTPNKNGLVLTFYKQVPFYSFADYSTKYAFSQGSADALKTNLAVSAKPYFASAQIDPLIPAQATKGKEFLRTTGVTSRAMLKRAPNPIGKPGGVGSVTSGGQVGVG